VGVFEGEKTRKRLTQERESKGNRERVGKSGRAIEKERKDGGGVRRGLEGDVE